MSLLLYSRWCSHTRCLVACNLLLYRWSGWSSRRGSLLLVDSSTPRLTFSSFDPDRSDLYSTPTPGAKNGPSPTSRRSSVRSLVRSMRRRWPMPSDEGRKQKVSSPPTRRPHLPDQRRPPSTSRSKSRTSLRSVVESGGSSASGWLPRRSRATSSRPSGTSTLCDQPLRSSETLSTCSAFLDRASSSLGSSRLPSLLPLCVAMPLAVFSLQCADGGLVLVCQTFADAPYNYNALHVGLVLVAFGGGNVIGSVFGGVYSDIVLARLKKRNGGIGKPEVRMVSLRSGPEEDLTLYSYLCRCASSRFTLPCPSWSALSSLTPGPLKKR